MAIPFKAGFLPSTSTVSSEEVTDNSGVQRTVYDSDGYLYQLDTKITATATELNKNAGVTAGTASASKVVVADANTSIAGLGIRFNESSHDYAGAAADWTLSAAEKNSFVLKTTNANGACAIVAPAETGRVYLVDNQSGQACTIKKAAGTGISIASTKRAIVWYNGTDYVRITADA